MSTAQIVTNLIATLVIFVFASFFVAAEFALVQTRPSQLEDMLSNKIGNQRKVKRALHMTHNLNEYLSTTQVGTTLVGVVLGWFSADTLAAIFERAFNLLELNHAVIRSLSAILGVILLTYLEVVVTEIVPKNIAIDMPVKILLKIVTPLQLFHTLVYPFVWLLNASSNGLLKMLGFEPADEENQVYSQSEIIKLSRKAVHGGSLDKNDLTYMKRAFELNDKIAKDIMTDRTRLVVINSTDSIRQALKLYLDEGSSRIPVVRDNNKDDIVGYIYAFDVIQQSQIDDKVPVTRIIRTMITVPESMPIQDILQLMIKKHTPIVLVVDEYGGTSGIVTDKDIYEELFGTVKDEIDDVSDDYIIRDEQGNIHVSGKTTLYDFARYFKTDLKSFQDSDIITIGGYMMEHYPDLKKGEKVKLEGFEFKLDDIEQGFMRWFIVKNINEKAKESQEE
ncbi:HlyC/CorC family transporter [Lactobacillus sp. ESL0260]|uniref:HlyC/CorC family transporter n=1 Tax=Lactobacillus melliventris TaxID=1218507 RepID=A0A0F4LEI3_9LACO|nr:MULTISPECIES: hemolysin family protein [Lactobacillus]KJY56995.1 Magnesium and cobalt efflux protein CorC [Lactobacillus melliventris]MBC6348697.1 HlyC/CorC family transporter [Lactobacillus melliventris]PXY84134.1 HlyC/CorC family transporter [Lactobacillus melliventris]RMC58677.1 HlyC/CorC family transporter [Lactobacillus sp. ESL0260]RMC61591.1 HlyC/CorC family transporter [Lactobacillus sp. ESL0259]